ncbi:MAG: hypothetical protein ACKVS8_05160 [Phycisphaerales bacterium]
MLFLLSMCGLALTIICGLIVAIGYLFRGYPLVSWRNIFLLGFVQFYALTVFLAAPMEFPSEFYHPTGEGYARLLVAMPLFLVVFMLCAKWAMTWEWPNRVVPQVRLPVTTGGVATAALVLATFSIASLALGGGTFGEAVTFFVRTAISTASVGLAFYLVMRFPKNPLWWSMFLGLFVFAAILSVVGSIDRRNFLSVFFVVPWMWFFYQLRYQRPTRVLSRLAVVASISLVCLIVYNAGRHRVDEGKATFEKRANQFTQLFQNPDFSARNIVQGLILQDTPLNTLAIMELYPDRYQHIPLHGLHFYLVNPIPRVIYPSKPVALGVLLQQQFDIAANLGAGIIGHGWFEAQWLGIIYYAVFFGCLVSVADKLVLQRLDNPFFVVAVGANLGNVLGLPRGETSMFLDMITAGFFSCLILYFLASSTLRPYMLLGRPIPAEDLAPLNVRQQWATEHAQDDALIDDPGAAAAYAAER